MNYQEINNKFIELNNNSDFSYREFLIFCNNLKKDNASDMLNLHYSFINKAKKDTYFHVFNSFSERPKDIIEPFLLEKLDSEKDLSLRADVIQLLGSIQSLKVLPYVKKNIKSEIRDIRYRCIIVIGWVGNKEYLSTLNERLTNEPDDELRGYAATAMRSLWDDNKATKDDILPYLYTAIAKEESEETLSSIIITIQDLLKRKFGLQEKVNDYSITGDVFKAKEKVLKFINKK